MRRQPSATRLTAKDYMVLDLSAQGLIAKEVATRLGNEPGRIENILDSIRDKTATKNTTAAVDYARTRDLLNPERDSLKIVLETFDALNTYDAVHFASLLHEEHQWQSTALSGVLCGQDAARQTIERIWAGFPDCHYHLENVVADGSLVVVEWRATATHRGTFAGIPPTNKKVEFQAVGMYVVQTSKIKRANVYWNPNDLFEPLRGSSRGRYDP